METLTTAIKIKYDLIETPSALLCHNPWDPKLLSTLKVLGVSKALQGTSADILNPQLRTQEQEYHQNQWLHKLEASKQTLESSGVQGAESAPVIELVDRVFEEALHEKATDLHFEPQEEDLKVRFRVDGILELAHELPKWLISAVVSRIKILADIDISEKRRAQDGQIRWREIDFRVSSLPTQFGEKLVVRVLGQQQIDITLDQLMMPEWILNAVQNNFAQAQGLFLVTGPTGSGKSSTLHAGLKELTGKPINISTIEDPIEYQLEGANQVQLNVKAGFDFPDALRSLLRQDPDVIFVGEIRDQETAQIALQAAQTGHLVVSTLHTVDAKSAVDRLKRLGCDEAVLNEVLLGVLAQRLVRKVKTDSSVSEVEYSGRMGIFEYLDSKTGQFSDLKEDALTKLHEGLTTREELIRVLGSLIPST